MTAAFGYFRNCVDTVAMAVSMRRRIAGIRRSKCERVGRSRRSKTTGPAFECTALAPTPMTRIATCLVPSSMRYGIADHRRHARRPSRPQMDSPFQARNSIPAAGYCNLAVGHHRIGTIRRCGRVRRRLVLYILVSCLHDGSLRCADSARLARAPG